MRIVFRFGNSQWAVPSVLVDTGAQINLISFGLVSELFLRKSLKVQAGRLEEQDIEDGDMLLQK